MQQVTPEVDKHYNGLASLETEFHAKAIAEAGWRATESGTMWLKKPGKMRWEYDNPARKLSLPTARRRGFMFPASGRPAAPPSSGSTTCGRRCAICSDTRNWKRNSLPCLSPRGEPLDRPADIVLSGVPKGMEDRISKVDIEVAPDSRISRISIYSLDGSVTDFRFENERDNVPISDERFDFDPPPGVEVLGATELGPVKSGCECSDPGESAFGLPGACELAIQFFSKC